MVVPFRIKDPSINSFSLQKFLKAKNWHCDCLAYPKNTLTYIYTTNNCQFNRVERLVKIIKKGLKEIRKNPLKWKDELKTSIYGLGIKIPGFIMGDAVKHAAGIINELPDK